MEYIVHYSDGSEKYLSHHGVKGMEWGVWNEETRLKYLGSPPEYGKDSDFDLLDELSQGDIEDFYSSGKISGFGTKSGMRYYNSIPDERLTLSKDTTFTTYGSSDKNLDGPLWTTWKEDATSTYKGFGDTRYELSPKKDFLVASMKDSYDTFTDLFSDESESGQSFRSSVYETRLGPLGKEKAHVYASAASHYPEAAASDCYKSFTHNQYKKTAATNTFFKEMDSKGFDGILDQNDIDDYTKQSPVIVLNPSESLELKSSVKHSETFNKKYLAHTQLTENELQKRHYAFPEKRKFPLPDRDHVLSAIKFFNYVSPNEEKILADAILKRMRELGMSDVNVGPTNKFRKYYSGPELKHHGIKGMKWGVWNEETATKYGSSGGTLTKGTVVSRVATSSKDPTYFNKKHVSTTKQDHDKWVDYLGEGYYNRYINTYEIMYKTTKDLKVANAKNLGKIYTDKILGNEAYSDRAFKDTESFKKSFLKETINETKMSDIASGHLASQTKTGERLIKELLKEGYGAVADTHGQNVAKDPLIVLNPDKNLKKVNVQRSKYWDQYSHDFAPKEKKLYED